MSRGETEDTQRPEARAQRDGDSRPARRAPPPAVVRRWVQVVVVALGLAALWDIVGKAAPVFITFLVASILALVLNPLVALVHRRHVPRGIAVAGVYIGFFAALAGAGVLLANPISSQVESFQRDVPSLVRSANHSLDSFQDWLDGNGINVHVKQQGRSALSTLQDAVVQRSSDIASFARDFFQKAAELSFALVLIVVISIYMLIYAEQIGRLVRSIVPRGDGSDEDDFPTLVQHAVFSYIRGQLLFSITMGLSAGVSLWIVGTLGIFPEGRDYAFFFGAFYGLMELVPYVGPVLGAIPPIVVALFNNPIDAVWLVLLFIALQQLEGHVVAPQVFGRSLRINPLVIMFALLAGAELYGILGAFLALPVASIVRESLVYLRRHVVFEGWGPPTLREGDAQPAPPGAQAPAEPEQPDGPPADGESAEPAGRGAR